MWTGWTGIELLHVFQDLDRDMPAFIDQFFIILARPEIQYFVPILMVAVLLWCFNRKQAVYLMINYGFICLVGYVVKNIIQQPRPWILDPSLDPSTSAKKGAPGYSLPSGHTTAGLASFGILTIFCRKNLLGILFLTITLLIPFSRMYLCVHTPIDIIMATVVAVVVCLINIKILDWSYENERNRTIVLIGYAVAAVLLTVVCDYYAGKPFSNKMCGLCAAAPICLLIEEKFIRYRIPDVPLKERLLPAIPGLAVLMITMETIYLTLPSYGITVAMGVGMVIVILVYPYLLKRRTDRIGADPSASAEPQ